MDKYTMQIGDIVMLKSGSSEMTVARLGRNGRVVCVWIDRREKVHRHSFPAAALRPMLPR